MTKKVAIPAAVIAASAMGATVTTRRDDDVALVGSPGVDGLRGSGIAEVADARVTVTTRAFSPARSIRLVSTAGAPGRSKRKQCSQEYAWGGRPSCCCAS